MVIFVSDMFVEDYVGGAELTTNAILRSCLMPSARIHSSNLQPQLMKEHNDAFWIFGNFNDLSMECLLYAIKNLNYSVLEYDYKFCSYRSPEKHIMAEKVCDCKNTTKGKAISLFLNSSKMTWWMSDEQKNRYTKWFPFFEKHNNKVLSSVFSDDTLDFIESLDTSRKDNKYLILNSKSWIKGVEDAIAYAKQNNLEYELVWGLEYKELLKKVAKSRGLIFFPRAGDTCPRMTIEAKLLGCELVLNDNVQHKDEEWFRNKEVCLSYMRKRTKIFWQTIENIWHLNTPKSHKTESDHGTFRIIVPFYNVESWIAKCIDSVKRQRESNFRCYLIDDISTDNSCNIVQSLIEGDERFELIKNTDKQYALGNIAGVLNQFNIDSNDVVVILDGDDWLASTNTLNHLSAVYHDKKCLVTYGNYVYSPRGGAGAEPSRYPESTIKENSFRNDKWRASHLRTFKYLLWKHVKQEDLKNDEGYYKVAYDQALMLPLLEMASERSEFIPEIMHVYNRNNPLNVDKVKQKLQHQTALEIRNKKSYERLD